MASIRRKSTSSFWYACYNREDGTRTQTSTKTKDARVARRIADELEIAHQNRATEGQMRKILSDLHERQSGQRLASATLNEYAVEWLAAKVPVIAPSTHFAYKVAIREFVEATPLKAGMGLQYLTPSDVAAFRNRCAARTSATTTNTKLKIVRTFLQSAWRDGHITENPAAKVQVLKSEESIRRPFTLPELARVLALAGDEWRGIVLVGLYTGQRLKDVATLNWASVDLPSKLITLTTSKTGKCMSIPIATPLHRHLVQWIADAKPDGAVFPKAAKLVRRDGNVGRLSQEFYELLWRAQLVTERPGKDESKGIGRSGRRQRNPLTFHCLRHTATSLLKNAGVSEAVAMDIIGHDSAEMSRHYTHIEDSAKRDALNKLPDVTVIAPAKSNQTAPAADHRFPLRPAMVTPAQAEAAETLLPVGVL